MKTRKHLLALLAMSLVLTVYGGVLGYRGEYLSDELSGVWTVVFALCVALWAHADAAVQKQDRPLDFSFWFFAVWPVALPIYLGRTRGVEGMILFAGFFLLYYAPFLSGLVAYTYGSAE